MTASVSFGSLETQAARFTPETARLHGRIGGSVTSEAKQRAARRNGRKGGRPRKIGKAHQRLIREKAALLDPREPLPNFSGCRVERITREQARPIILRFEWLGTMGRAKAWYGLRAPNGELLGCVGFGQGPGSQARDICGTEYRKVAACLERGACVHYAPRNAASFLIRRAVRLAHLEHGWEIFFSYCDPEAGEIGVVYKACGWAYVGQGVGRTPGRPRDHFVKPNGSIVGCRNLRHGGLKMGDVLGWRRVQTAPKHRYVWFEGPRAEELRAACRYPFKPYPKRDRKGTA